MYKISILSHPCNLSKVREKIGEIAEEAGFTHDNTKKIVLAVDEACTNIIRHSYLNDYTKKININAKIKNKELEIAIQHYGLSPDPEKITGCRPKIIRPGGLGVYFIRRIMDKVVYNGRKIILCKSRPK